ncbi:MAG: DUF5698 domain-containing protein [bacterium]
MTLFIIGVVEMLIATAWTRTVTKTQVLASSTITLINVLIWYYVLQQIVDNISNWSVVFLYALGCSVGTAITTLYYQINDKNEVVKKRKSLITLTRTND